jgi:hypothetical protein
MDCTEQLDSDYLAMAELTKEIGSLVQRSIDQNNPDLASSEIEHILSMTANVTLGMKFQIPELTV